MPTYFYPCPNKECMFEEETFKKSPDDLTIKPCIKCGTNVERQMFSFMWEDSEKGKYIQDKGWNNEKDKYNFNQKKRNEEKEQLKKKE